MASTEATSVAVPAVVTVAGDDVTSREGTAASSPCTRMVNVATSTAVLAYMCGAGVRCRAG